MYEVQCYPTFGGNKDYKIRFSTSRMDYSEFVKKLEEFVTRVNEEMTA